MQISQPGSTRLPQSPTLTRRRFLGISSATAAGLLVAGCASQPAGNAIVPTSVPSGAPAGASSGPAATTLPSDTATPTTAAAQPSASAAPASTATAQVAPSVQVTPAQGAISPQSKPSQALDPTPACGNAGDVTPPMTEGPFFRPGSPERNSLLEPGMAGTRLTLTGRVLSTDCRPIPQALLDFWQADDGGQYDNSGFRLRGHQFSDATGRYQLETIIPGLYPGRTRHIHVKVQAPNQPALTTQLFLPGEPRNSADGIFSSKLVVSLRDAPAGGKLASFDFVLKVG